jgi:hypothetical protein
MERQEMDSCPDCSARPNGNRITHDKTCPLGLAIDKVMEADREWFENHPNSSEYWRPASRAEIQDYAMMTGCEPDYSLEVRCCVQQLGPGLRKRSFQHKHGGDS